MGEEEVDEYGVPILKKRPSIQYDEYGVPILKKKDDGESQSVSGQEYGALQQANAQTAGSRSGIELATTSNGDLVQRRKTGLGEFDYVEGPVQTGPGGQPLNLAASNSGLSDLEKTLKKVNDATKSVEIVSNTNWGNPYNAGPEGRFIPKDLRVENEQTRLKALEKNRKELKDAEDAKAKLLEQNKGILNEPVDKIISSGSYKTFIDEDGIINTGKLNDWAKTQSESYGGGSYIRDMYMSNLRRRIQYEQDRPIYEPILKEEIEKSGVDIKKYGQQLYDKISRPSYGNADMVSEEAKKTSDEAFQKATTSATQLESNFNSIVENLNGQVTAGLITEDQARATFSEIYDEYASNMANIDNEYRGAVNTINQKAKSKITRINKELESLSGSIEFGAILKAMPEAERKKVEAAYLNAGLRLGEEKNKQKKAQAQESWVPTLKETSLSFISGWHSTFAGWGKFMASDGESGAFSDWFINRQTQSDRYAPASYEWNKDEWYKRALTAGARSLGASAPSIIPAIAASATMNAGSVPLWANVIGSAAISWTGENTQIAGDAYGRLLDEKGDVNEAYKYSRKLLSDNLITGPFYLFGGLGNAIITKAGVSGVKKLITAGLLEQAEELPTEYIQAWNEAPEDVKALGKIQFIKDNPEIAADTFSGTLFQSGAMSAFVKSFSYLMPDGKAGNSQFISDMIKNKGVTFAEEMMKVYLEKGVIDQTTFESNVSDIRRIGENLERLGQMGVADDAARLYVSLSDNIRQLESDVNNATDESVKAVAEKRLSDAKGELKGVIDGTAPYIVFNTPGGLNSSFSMTVDAFNRLDSEKQKNIIQHSDGTTVIGDPKFDAVLRDTKKAVGNPINAPDGMYVNESGELRQVEVSDWSKMTPEQRVLAKRASIEGALRGNGIVEVNERSTPTLDKSSNKYDRAFGKAAKLLRNSLKGLFKGKESPRVYMISGQAQARNLLRSFGSQISDKEISRGWYDPDTNSAFVVGNDTRAAIHESLMHPIVDMVRQLRPDVFNEFVKDISRIKLGRGEQAYYIGVQKNKAPESKTYGELNQELYGSGELAGIETVVSFLSDVANQRITDPSIIQQIMDAIKRMLAQIGIRDTEFLNIDNTNYRDFANQLAGALASGRELNIPGYNPQSNQQVAGNQQNQSQPAVSPQVNTSPVSGATPTGSQNISTAAPTSGNTAISETADVTVGDILDKSGIYKGKKGIFYKDPEGQSVLFKPEGENRIYEIGNIDEIANKPISSLGIEYSESIVETTEDGNFIIRGNEYTNKYSNPLMAINQDGEGNIVSVNLETPDGKKRTFRGNIAEDIAYQIKLKQITQNNEQLARFEEFINSPGVSSEIRGLSETSTQEAPGTSQQVPMESGTERSSGTGQNVGGGSPMLSITKAGELSKQNISEYKEAKRKLAKAGEEVDQVFFNKFWPKMLKAVGMTLSPSKRNYSKALEMTMPDFINWLKGNPRYLDYYNKDWEQTAVTLKNQFPNATDDDIIGFRIFTGLTSPSTKLPDNLTDAVKVFDMWMNNNNLSGISVTISPKGNMMASLDNKIKLASTTGATKIRSLKAVEMLRDKLGSWDNVLKYLSEPVSAKELNEFNKSLGYKSNIGDIGGIRQVVKEATGQDKLIPRMFVFGKKVGAYTMNTTGDGSFTTTDIWESRFIRSHFPAMFKDGSGLPENVSESKIFQEFATFFNEELKKIIGQELSPAAFQAARWFYMIETAREAGYEHAKTSEAISGYTERAIQKVFGRVNDGVDNEGRQGGNGENQESSLGQVSQSKTKVGDVVSANVSMAPMYSLKADNYAHAKAIHETDYYKEYLKRNVEIAGMFGLEVVDQQDTFGAYSGVSEASTNIVVNGPFEAIVEYSAVISALAPEIQDAVIPSMYVQDGDENHTADAYEFTVGNVGAAIVALKDAGFDQDGYTINGNKVIVYDLFFGTKPQKGVTRPIPDQKIPKFAQRYQYETGQQPGEDPNGPRRAVRSEFIGRGVRSEILGKAPQYAVQQRPGGPSVRDVWERARKRSDAFLGWKQALVSEDANGNEVPSQLVEDYRKLNQKKFDAAAGGEQFTSQDAEQLKGLEVQLADAVRPMFEVDQEAYQQSKAEIDAIGAELAGLVVGGYNAEYKTKKPSRASIKSVRWYDSQPNLLGDGSRTTVIASTDQDAQRIFDEIQLRFPNTIGRTENNTTELGYPKRLTEIRTSNGKISEIQVMTPMGYLAKEGAKNFPPDQIDPAKELLNDIQNRLGFKIPDGIGHYFYELHRDPNVPASIRQKAQYLSNQYYDAFLNPESELDGQKFGEDLLDLKTMVDSADKSTWDAGNTAQSPKSMDKFLGLDGSVSQSKSMSPTSFEDTVNEAGYTVSQVEDWRRSNKVNQKQTRIPEVQQAAERYRKGEIDYPEYNETVNKYQGITPINSVPDIPSLLDVISSLDRSKVEKGIVGVTLELNDGQRVATRLDIPAYEDFDTWVVSIHDGNSEGKSIGYGQTAVLQNVEFKTNPKVALNIASAKTNARGEVTPKSTIARMFGDWVNEDPIVARERAINAMNDPSYVQVGMNPFRHSWFYDKATGQPVVGADEVIQIGALVLARNPVIGNVNDPQFKTTNEKGDTIYFSKSLKRPAPNKSAERALGNPDSPYTANQEEYNANPNQSTYQKDAQELKKTQERYDNMSINELNDEIDRMGTNDLRALFDQYSGNDNFSNLALIELIKRYEDMAENGATQAERAYGEAMAKKTWDDMKTISSSAAQLLRQTRELYAQMAEANPDSIANTERTAANIKSIIKKQLKEQGVVLDGDQEIELDNLIAEYTNAAKSEAKAKKKYMQTGLQKDYDALIKATKRAEDAYSAINNWMEDSLPRSFAQTWADLIKGSLLTLKSIAVNVGGNVINMMQYFSAETSLVPAIRSGLRLAGFKIAGPGVGTSTKATWMAMDNIRQNIWPNVKAMLMGGSTRPEDIRKYQIRQVIKPWVRLRQAAKTIANSYDRMRGKDERYVYGALPKVYRLSGGLNVEAHTPAGHLAAAIADGVFGWVPAFNFHMLSATDKPFREPVRMTEATMILADKMNWETPTMKQVMDFLNRTSSDPNLNATKEELQRIELAASKFLYSNEKSVGAKLASIPPKAFEAMAKYIEGDESKMGPKELAIRSMMATPVRLMGTFLQPYTTVPANVLSHFIQLAVPVIPIMQGSASYMKKDYVQGDKYMGRAFLGFTLMSLSAFLTSAGLIIAGDDEDKAEDRALKNMVGGPKRINMSAVKRLLTNGDTSMLKDDWTVPLYLFGVPGMVIDLFSRFRGDMVKDDKWKDGYLDTMFSDQFGATLGAYGVSSAKTAMEMSFLTGHYELLNAFMDHSSMSSGQYWQKGFARVSSGIAETAVTPMNPYPVLGGNMFSDIMRGLAAESGDRPYIMKPSDNSAVDMFWERIATKNPYPMINKFARVNTESQLLPALNLWGEPVANSMSQSMSPLRGRTIEDETALKLYNWVQSSKQKNPISFPTKRMKMLFDDAPPPVYVDENGNVVEEEVNMENYTAEQLAIEDAQKFDYELTEVDYAMLLAMSGTIRKWAIAKKMNDLDFVMADSDKERYEMLRAENTSANAQAKNAFIQHWTNLVNMGMIDVDIVNKRYSYKNGNNSIFTADNLRAFISEYDLLDETGNQAVKWPHEMKKP